MNNANDRLVEEVVNSYLRPRKEEAALEDVCRAYAVDVVLLTGRAVYRGYDGVRRSAGRLRFEFHVVDHTDRYTLSFCGIGKGRR
jgi:hypothetical protein